MYRSFQTVVWRISSSILPYKKGGYGIENENGCGYGFPYAGADGGVGTDAGTDA